MWPPGNANARQATGRREELTNKPPYSLPRISQAILAGWRQEAARLLSEHLRSADPRHLRAFYRHCGGMGGRLRRGDGRCRA
jgi:hypothetical protein